jgi:hypothetical protein
MTNCTYCGRENEGARGFCRECGTNLREEVPEMNPQIAKAVWVLLHSSIVVLCGYVVVCAIFGRSIWQPRIRMGVGNFVVFALPFFLYSLGYLFSGFPSTAGVRRFYPVKLGAG